MEGKDNIKDLFAKKLAEHEVPVKPELWNGVASQIGAGSAIGGGLSIGAKVAIGIGLAASVIGGSYFVISNSDQTKTQQEQVSIVENDKNPQIEETIINETSPTTSSELHQERIQTEVNTETVEEEAVEAVVSLEEEIRPLEKVTVPSILLLTEEELDQSINYDEGPVEDVKIEEQLLEEDPLEELTPLEVPTETAEVTKIPNIFTPNGDRDNDEFFIEYNGKLLDFQIVIMNQQNQVIYQSNNPDFKWNGVSQQGDEVAEGNYYYILTTRDSNDNPINKYGQITVRR